MNNQTFPRMTFHSIRHALLAGLLLLAGACSQNSDESLPTEDELVEVDFLLSGYAASAGEEVADPAATRATTTPLAEGTTVRIFAIVAGQGTVAAQQTYYMKGGRLVPCTVDAVGKFVADAPSAKLSLPPATYNFCTITPAVEAPGLSVKVRQNMDFALSQTLNKTVAFAGIVPLEPLQRKCARVQLKVKRDDASTAITALSVKSATVTGFSVDQTTAPLGIFSLTPVSAGTKSATTTDFAPENGNPLVSIGNLYLLPTVAQAFPVEVAYEVQHTILGIDRIETYKGKVTLSVAAGKSYTLTATIAKDGGINLTLEPWKDENWSTDTGQGIYPYVKDGKYIVSRDAYGASSDKIHEPWFQTPDHDSDDIVNGMQIAESVAACFQVDVSNKTSTWISTNGPCLAPWRRPTIREMDLINSLRSKFSSDIAGFGGWIYSATINANDRSVALAFKYEGNGNRSQTATWVSQGTRCVQDIIVGTQYPYVVQGKYIVSKDTGGHSGVTLHPNWSSTPDHTDGEVIGGIKISESTSVRFQVADNDYGYHTWGSTNGACDVANSWRRPTIKELEVINQVRGMLTAVARFDNHSTNGNWYHSATKSTLANNSRSFKFLQGVVNVSFGSYTWNRCIKDF